MWTNLCKTSEIKDGEGKVVETPSTPVALFKTGGKIYALLNTCPHRGGPLGEGSLDSDRVTCPWHAWEFDVTTGKCLTMEGAQQTRYPTKVENGEVFVDL